MSPDEFEELFGLYCKANCNPDLSAKEAIHAQQLLAQRLQQIWNSEKLPFPYVYHDFRRLVIDRILERLRKEDPRYRRPKF